MRVAPRRVAWSTARRYALQVQTGHHRRSPSTSIETDWHTTVIGAFSFLVHFAGVAVLFSEWGDRVLPLEGEVSGLVELVGTPNAVPAVEERPSSGHATAGATSASVVKTAPVNATATASSRDLTRFAAELLGDLPPSASGVLDARTAPSLTTESDPSQPRVELTTIGVRATSDTRGGDVHADSNQPLIELGELARSLAGTRPPRRWLGKRSGLLIGPGPPDDARSMGAGVVVPPKPSVSIGTDTGITGGTIPGAERVLRGVNGRVRGCYAVRLGSDPDTEGRVAYTVTVNRDGEVTDVSTAPSGTLSPSVVACIQGVLRGARFERPTAAPASIRGSYSFVNGAKASR